MELWKEHVDDGEPTVMLRLEQLAVSPIVGEMDVARETVPVNPAPKLRLTVVELVEPETKLMFVPLSEIANA